MAARKKKAAGKKKSAAKLPTKSEIMSFIAGDTGLAKKEVVAVFESLSNIIQKNIGGRSGPGKFAIPGLMKIKVVKKPATKARKGINPFTGEECIFKAKPARKVVKVQPLKGLKDMV
ncbi:MAG: HU family DNA-binding protein [Gammaproteobacteria bacterium]